MANLLNYNYPWGYDYSGDSGTGMINPPAFPGGSGVDEDEMNTAIQSAVDKLVGTAPEALDTLGEIAEALESGDSATEALIQQINKKLDIVSYESDKETFAKINNVYTKEQSDAKFLTEHQDISGLATKAELEEVSNSIPTKVSDIENDSDFISVSVVNEKLSEYSKTSDFATVATSGSYNDLTDKPEIPVIPQNVSAFTNDAGYLTRHQDISGLATKEDVETGDKNIEKSILGRIWSKPTEPDKGYFQTKYTNDNGSYAQIWNEFDGGGSQYFNAIDNIMSYVGVNDGGKNDICVQIYSKDKETNVGSRLNVNPNGMFYAVGSTASIESGRELAVKDDITESEAQLQAIIDEKNAIISSLNTELYNLKKVVGNIGGAVTYELPGVENKSFGTLMNNNGTVKLTDNVTTGRFGPGIFASNRTTLNLNGKNLTVTGLSATSSYPAIMSRGTQEITITGKGIIDAGEGICIEVNSADSIINLNGTTTTYHTNRPGGELIYCYVGTINISGGTFRNDGESGFTLNCYDANYKNGTAKIIVTGGKFYDFDPGNNRAEGENTSFLAEGYVSVPETIVEDGIEHIVYTVKKAS